MTGSRLHSLIRFCRKFVIHTVVYFEYIALNPFHSHVKVFFKNQDPQFTGDESTIAEYTKLSGRTKPIST